jgi:thiosulfate/3-mercaptopyruvate sulfurtransferase
MACGVACGETTEYEDPRPTSEQTLEPDPLDDKIFVTADELQDAADNGAIIIDSRAPDLYAEGHFPGAINIEGGKPWKDDFGFLPPFENESQIIARDFGLTRSKEIVIYADARSKRASRLAWTLEYLGHGEVSLYTPGYEQLQGELGFEASTDTPDLGQGDFVVSHREAINATGQEVKDAIDGQRQALLIDTRRQGEYNGSEDRGDPRQGTIPGSVWYYWENIFTEDDQLRPREELRAEFEEQGLLVDDAVLIPYCQTGTRSTYMYYVLRWLGQQDVANYDGSWVEWSRENGYPVETPEQ